MASSQQRRRWTHVQPSIRWQNVPIPEPHVTALVLSVFLHAFRPIRLVRQPYRVRQFGWVLIALSVSGVVAAVRAAGTETIENPKSLRTAFPYSHSRNPMYVAWTGLYVGSGLLWNNVWPFVFLPAVAGWTHLVVRREEATLARTFDAEYHEYRATVRRYL
ncbi:methyltransferase family protein [Haladaptatus sp. CMSO5]|uniref:methyltransferase family protein n=1 Tax=Haladaptatus sp. CMSO5 TaxID=3120514 RepID=UPI002FCE31EF